MFSPDTDVLAAQTTTLPMALQTAGYQTVFIGPVADPAHHIPLDKGLGRGFDTILPFTSFSDASESIRTLMKQDQKKPLFVFIHSFELRNNSIKTAPSKFPLDPTYRYGYIDHYLNSVTLQTKDSAANIASYRRIYDERLRQIDIQLGTLLQTIQTISPKNTIITITSDHGEEFGEHGQSTHGVNLYPPTTHIPLIMSIPNTQNAISNILTQSIDITPTLLSLTGIPLPHSVHGRIIYPFWNNANTVLISQLEPQKRLVAVRTTLWSYHFDPTSPKSQKSGKLYNRTTDPRELNNVASQYPKVIETLLSEYAKRLTL